MSLISSHKVTVAHGTHALVLLVQVPLCLVQSAVVPDGAAGQEAVNHVSGGSEDLLKALLCPDTRVDKMSVSISSSMRARGRLASGLAVVAMVWTMVSLVTNIMFCITWNMQPCWVINITHNFTHTILALFIT